MSKHSFLLTEHQALKRRRWLRGMAVIMLGCMVSYMAVSRQNGAISGLTSTTSTGCSCHNASPSSATTLAVTGPTSVNAGSTSTYTATVSHSTQAAAGINLGVKTTATGTTDAGTLSPSNSDLQLYGTELTHTAPKNMTAGSASFTFTWTAPNTPGTYYIQAAGNAVNLSGTNAGDVWNWLSPVAVTVNGVVLTSPNGGETWCPGSTQNITWSSFGVTNVKIELSSDGTNWTTLNASVAASSGSWAWAIPSNTTPGTNYSVRVSDAANASRIDASNAPFTIGGVPSISTQPTARTICQGQATTFSVTATGSGLSYQWRKDGNPINGATNSSYTINNAAATHAGNYDVVVSNNCGSVTSNSVGLTVNTRPQITTSPASQQICLFEAVTFSVTATGTDLTYQWKKNGTDINGATNATYTIGTVAAADAGTYSVVVSGACSPSATSANAQLVVTTLPSITTHPVASQSLCEGDALTLSVTATGSDLTYQWRRNGVAIDSARGATLTIPSISATQGGKYDVVVSGACPPAQTSSETNVTVTAAPNVTTQPTPQTVLVGSNASFTVVATGSTLSYQWRKNGTPINGATSATLSLTNVKHADSGTYDVRILNRCDTIVSGGALLTVKDAGAGALLTLTQSSVDFGSVPVGGTSDVTLTDLIRNTGDSVLTVSAMTIIGANPTEFTIVSGGAPFTLAPGAAQTVVLKFSPTSKEEKTAAIEFTSNAAANPTLPLQGVGSAAGFSVTPSTLSFDVVNVGSTKVLPLIYCNTGGSPLTVTELSLSSAGFTVLAPPTLPQTLAPGECDTVEVQFAPTAEGAASGEIMIITAVGSSNDTVRVPASGTGGNVTSVRTERSVLGSVSIVPNPTRGEAVISLGLAAPSVVELAIIDAAGKTVRTYTEQVRSIGKWQWRWDGKKDDGSNCESGSYRVLLRAGESTLSQPLVLVR